VGTARRPIPEHALGFRGRREPLREFSHALLLAGIGWGSMPEPMVRADLDAGRLVHLQLLDFRGGVYPFQVAHRNESPPGTAGQWLIECLINHDDLVER
jgi:DNA-binding transcriptional LysR family regulator